MRRAVDVFHRFMSYESPWTDRQRYGLGGAMLAGLILFMGAYGWVFHSFFSVVAPGPRPLMVWICAAIFLAAALVPRFVPATVATYPRAFANAFFTGLGVLALLGLGMTYLDTLPLPFSAIGYVILMLTIFRLAVDPNPPKPTQDSTPTGS